MSDTLKVLNFEGGLGIQDVSNFAKKLTDLLDQECNTIINLANIDALDLSCIQVILSAKRFALSKGITIQLSNQISKEATFALFVCGLIPNPDMSGKEINKALDNAMGGKS